VHPLAKIQLSAQAQHQRASLATVLLHKPPGVVSNQPEKGYPEAVSLITGNNRADTGRQRQKPIPKAPSLHVAGRLDIDSAGLLVLTQDGTVARTLIGPDSRIEKEYHVGVDGDITSTAIEQLRSGLVLDDRPLLPALITHTRPGQLEFVLTEGRKRQIRRMCELVGLSVRTLVRVRIGQVLLGQLRRGQWRHLTNSEVF
jgi:23S rRNA pseudouridine2604 synthase